MKKLLMTVLLAIALLSSSFNFLVNSNLEISGVETGWWDHNWGSRRKVEIGENSGVNLTDFPIQVTFQHDGAIQSNGTDVRVVDDGIEIPSYIEITNGSHAKVIFEVNLTAFSTNNLYIYYNNPNASFPNYELVSLNVSEGNTGYAIIDNSVYIGWDYTSWGGSNNVELWNDFRVDFNGNNDPTDDNDLIRDYGSRQGGIGKHRRDTQAFGLGSYQTFVHTPIFVELKFENATLKVFRSQNWVESTQADFLWLFSNTYDYVNLGMGFEENIIDGSGWSFFYNSSLSPIWSAFRDSSTGELIASSAFNIGNDYNYWVAAKESSDYDREINHFGETAFSPVSPYDQPTDCRIYWYGDNSNNYTKIERMATILHNQPTVITIPDLITVPDEFSTIQEAINAASDRDTIFVRNGTYYENVVVNKTVSLIGEDRVGTVVDGGGFGNVVKIVANNVLISNFTIRNTTWPHSGLVLDRCNNTKVLNNTIKNSFLGIYLFLSSNNTLVGNNMAGNTNNFGVLGMTLSEFVHFVDLSNMVDGKPIYYWIDKWNMTIPSEAGYVALINCTRITIQNLNLTSNWHGILLAYTTNSTITNNNITDNYSGIRLYESSNNRVSGNRMSNNGDGIFLTYSSNNTVVGNNITNNHNGVSPSYSSDNKIIDNNIINNYFGVFLEHSANNIFYHNNFINNTVQVESHYFVNTWDNGCEGNYWSDHNGTDSNGNGIGDTTYIIDEYNQDNYPLMNPYWIPADINHDLEVDIFDVVLACVAYSSTPSDLNWNCHGDIAEPYGVIDIFDIVMITRSYGEEYSP